MDSDMKATRSKEIKDAKSTKTCKTSDLKMYCEHSGADKVRKQVLDMSIKHKCG